MTCSLIHATGAEAIEERAAYTTGRLPERERDVVAVITEGLQLLGYVCLRCQQWRADRAGSDAGLPDLLVTSERWPEGAWLGVEVKGTAGKLSPAQRRLSDAGRIAICRSFEDALQEVRRFEQRLRLINP